MVDERRRALIISEIEKWRRSKLLPEQYCDFLLNLYMDESAASAAFSASPAARAIAASHWKTWLIVFAALTIIVFVSIHFTSIPLPLQIGIFAVPVFLSYVYGIVHRGRKPLRSHLTLGAGSVLMLAAGPLLLKLHGAGEPHWVAACVAFSGLVWVAVGISLRNGLLHFCGWMAIGLVYAWTIYVGVERIHWTHVQLMWIPLAVIFLWLAWITHGRQRVHARVFFAMGVIFWIVPDALSLWLFEPGGWIQFAIFVKLAIAAAMMYAFRNQWTKWVG
jgi:hypothetical protein